MQVPELGEVTGDVAWGGNWFFLIEDHPFALELANVETLTGFTMKVRNALISQGITGDHGTEIDHVELFGSSANADSRNFVLCPGNAYDRSPCGTGTSAKLACLYSDGKLRQGDIWRQESIIGSQFEGTVKIHENKIIPLITGTAYVNAEIELILDPLDQFCYGIRK